MDWTAAIEKNREALKRILAMLVAMAGLGSGGQFYSACPTHRTSSREGAARRGTTGDSLLSFGGKAAAFRSRAGRKK
jgi:hypothetical protein